MQVKATILETTKSVHISVNGTSTAIIKYVMQAKFSKISGILFLYNTQGKEVGQINVGFAQNIIFVPKSVSKFKFDDMPEEVKVGL